MASLATLHDGLAMVARSWSDMSAASCADEDLDDEILEPSPQNVCETCVMSSVFVVLYKPTQSTTLSG